MGIEDGQMGETETSMEALGGTDERLVGKIRQRALILTSVRPGKR